MAKKYKDYQRAYKDRNRDKLSDWRKRNRAKLNKKSAEFRRQRADWLAEFKKTLSCQRCGEKDPVCLDFHHRDPSKKDGNIGSLVRGRSEANIMKEIDKCDILCANCHRKEHERLRLETLAALSVNHQG